MHMNKSSDLRSLFRQSLINARKRASSSYTPNPIVSGYRSNNYPSEVAFKDIRIYFYEWSDISKAPRCFYFLDAFKSFLRASGIFLQLYQEDIIKNLGTVYITCYTGTKDLNIRGTYKNLMDSMKEYDTKRLLPNVVNSTIKPPKIIFETANTMPKNDGTFFG